MRTRGGDGLDDYGVAGEYQQPSATNQATGVECQGNRAAQRLLSETAT